MNNPTYNFIKQIGRIINSGQSNSLLLTGNVHDLFHVNNKSEHGDYLPIINFLLNSWEEQGFILINYELNAPIRFSNPADKKKIKDAWLKFMTGLNEYEIAAQRLARRDESSALAKKLSKDFDHDIKESIGQPTMALEVLRQICLAARSKINGEPILKEKLIIIIEGADILIPEANINQLSDADRHRVMICHDWFGDPGFMNSDDSVILLAESRGSLNQRINTLPSIEEITISLPDTEQRAHFISWFRKTNTKGKYLKLWGKDNELAQSAAGLSIQALRQLLIAASYRQKQLNMNHVVNKVEEHIKNQLGDDVIEFKKPEHKVDDLVGFSQLKVFLKDELIPRLKSTGPDALPGAAVGGPIGSGKTYIFEAVAAELNIPVLVLKNIRSKWYGETDIIFERLYRVINALNKVMIFVDEADTQFGGVGAESHSTERRLTGKIQAMMSDPRLRGKVAWLLMTARIHLLSPDIRRPGRVGDLIIPVLDPQGDDHKAFVQWMIKSVAKNLKTTDKVESEIKLMALTKDYSAAAFASLRSELIAKAKGEKLDIEQIIKIAHSRIPPAISDTRDYQKLQALMNCTLRDLLPDPEVNIKKQRQKWLEQIKLLEAQGIR